MKKDKEVAISIKNVSKDFKLPHHNQPSSVKSIFVNPFQKKEQQRDTVEKQHALKDISFDIFKGEFFGIVGKNGSGKSTLLKIIAGIYKANNGTVQYNGKLVPFIELGVGFNPELSGRDNVYLSGALMGFSTKDVDKKYRQIVEFAELERFMDQLLKNYSSGMQVRLAFSVATILGDSDILLIDEVLAVGDADFQRKCFNYFKTLKKLKKTVVFVSHDMNAVKEFCDRAALISDSKLVEVGGSEKVANAYSKLFLDLDDDNEDDVTENDGRYGTGDIKIDAVRLAKKNLVDDDDSLELIVDVQATRDVSDVVFGFSIKNAEGDAICGSNTQIKNLVIKSIKKSSKHTIVWRCENIFTDGKHSVTVAAHSSDGVTNYDWWPEAALFTVRRSERSPFKISPPITVEIK